MAVEPTEERRRGPLEGEDDQRDVEIGEFRLQEHPAVFEFARTQILSARRGTFDDVGETDPGSKRSVVLIALAGRKQTDAGETSEEALPGGALIVVAGGDTPGCRVDTHHDGP